MEVMAKQEGLADEENQESEQNQHLKIFWMMPFIKSQTSLLIIDASDFLKIKRWKTQGPVGRLARGFDS